MDGWDDQARRDSINWQFGQGQLIHEDYDPLDSFTILDSETYSEIFLDLLQFWCIKLQFILKEEC